MQDQGEKGIKISLQCCKIGQPLSVRTHREDVFNHVIVNHSSLSHEPQRFSLLADCCAEHRQIVQASPYIRMVLTQRRPLEL